MNPCKVELLIAHVLNKRSSSTADRYHLCIVAGKLKIIGAASRIIPELIIATMTELQIINGFSSGQWDSMSSKIIQYCERNKKCLKDLIP